MAIISLKNVTKDYQLGKTVVHTLKGVSCNIEKGDFITIAGPSGSGKSTILNMIGCIDTSTSGTVGINDTDTSTPGTWIYFSIIQLDSRTHSL